MCTIDSDCHPVRGGWPMRCVNSECILKVSHPNPLLLIQHIEMLTSQIIGHDDVPTRPIIMIAILTSFRAILYILYTYVSDISMYQSKV